MSIGLMNASASFFDLMNQIFRNFLDIFVLIFVVDILVYSKFEMEHERYLQVVQKTLQTHQPKAKFTKYHFW